MSKEPINRRDFLLLSSLGIAGTFVPLSSAKDLLASEVFYRPSLHVSEKDRAVRVIDPSPSDIFQDPPLMPNLTPQNGIIDVTLDVKMAPVKVGGTTANLLTYNGVFPAQTIRVRQGNRLKVTLKNSLPATHEKNLLGHTKNITNLHTHGWHVSPSGNSDNVFVTVKPGEEFQHEYDTSKQEAGTLSYYHPHFHGLVAEQQWSGLGGGALIVEDDTKVLSDFETHIFILKNISLDGSEPSPYTEQDFLDGKEGDMVLVNGRINPVLNIKPGQVQRWRVVNAGTAKYYKLSLENHKLYVAGTDGGLLDKPYPVSEILITPGERVDLLVKADNKPGTFKLLSLPYDRRGNELQKITLMTVEYKGKPVKENIPKKINPHAKRLDSDIDISALPKRKLYFIMANGQGFVNLKDFNEEPYVLTSKVGTYEIWELINISPMDHPIHQHVNPAQILSITGGDQGYTSLYTSTPAWKDTINIPFQGKLTMLVPVKDFTGKALFHCHILEHEDIGMMGIWEMV